VTRDEYATMRTEAAHGGDPELFVRKMLSLAFLHNYDDDALKDVFFGTEIRNRHSATFVKTFAKLMKSAEAVDHDDMVVNALLHGSPSGLLYRTIRYHQGEEEFDPISGLTGIQSYTVNDDSQES